jgi:outer membrane protein assembly factor BamA
MIIIGKSFTINTVSTNKYLFDLGYKLAIRWTVIALLFYGTRTVYAQDSTMVQSAGIEDTVVRKSSFVPLQVFFVSPENGIGFGFLGAYLFEFDFLAPDTRTSNIQGSFIYTTKNQILTNLQYTIFTNEEKYFLSGEVNYNVLTDLYWGIGKETPNDAEERVDYDLLSFEPSFLRRIKPRLFAGFEFRHFHRYSFQREPDGLLDSTQVPGYDGSTIAGLGPVVVYDTRDIVINPTTGYFLEFSAFFHGNFFGGEYDFSRFRLDLRKYFLLNERFRQVLAIQFQGNFVTGTAPFKQLSELGGDDNMRGYFRGRFRDNHMMFFQTEFRTKIWWRFGGVVFAGLGNVANEFSDFDFREIKPAYGAGIRFALNRKEYLNIRVDFGFGTSGNSGFYFNVTETF